MVSLSESASLLILLSWCCCRFQFDGIAVCLYQHHGVIIGVMGSFWHQSITAAIDITELSPSSQHHSQHQNIFAGIIIMVPLPALVSMPTLGSWKYCQFNCQGTVASTSVTTSALASWHYSIVIVISMTASIRVSLLVLAHMSLHMSLLPSLPLALTPQHYCQHWYQHSCWNQLHAVFFCVCITANVKVTAMSASLSLSYSVTAGLFSTTILSLWHWH